MYPNYQMMRNNPHQYQMYNYQNNQVPSNDDRFLGLFAVPFLLGGLTGAALAPRRPYPVPYPAPYPVTPYYPYPKPYVYSTSNYYYK